MRPLTRALAAACCAGLVLGAALDGQPAVEREQPPVAHTGGFGEPTCQSCHFQAAVNEGPGSLALEGMPDRYTAGSRYALTVVLTQKGMRAGGFQLAIRDATTGRQAGELATPHADLPRAGLSVHDGVTYAHHVAAGVELTAPDTIRWTVMWTAPAEYPSDAPGSIVLHLVANAADDDASPLGDMIYQRVVTARTATK